MLHAGLDLSRRKVDVCLLSEQGELLDQRSRLLTATRLSLARRVEETYREPVCTVVESMSGARFVHDTLEQAAWGGRDRRRSEVKGLFVNPDYLDDPNAAR